MPSRPTSRLLRRSRIGGFLGGVLIWSGAGCTTPPQIVEQSAATTALYAQLDQTFQTWHDAVRSELKRRAREQHLGQVRTGRASVNLAGTEGGDEIPFDRWLAMAFDAFPAELDLLRIAHGIVDRFLRIEVIDLDDVEAVTRRGRRLFEQDPDGGGGAGADAGGKAGT